MLDTPSQEDIDKYVDAARTGDVAFLTEWLDRFGVKYIDACNADGQPALSTAAYYQQAEAAMTLLDRGADISFEGEKGTYSPLICAASRALPTVVRALLEMGADVNESLKPTHHTPLHYAVMKGSPEVALMLLAYGADITAQTDTGWHVREPGWLVEENNPALAAMRQWKESDRDAWHEKHGPYDPGAREGIRHAVTRHAFEKEAVLLTEGLRHDMQTSRRFKLALKTNSQP
jgi:ankyrin repeat protein